MIIVNCILFGTFFILLCTCGFVNRKSEIEKERFLLIRLFYLEAECLYKIYSQIHLKFPIIRKDQREQLIEKQLDLINPAIPAKEQRYSFQIQKIVMGLLLAFIGSGMCLLSSISIITTNQLIDNRFVMRNNYDGMNKDITLSAQIDDYVNEFSLTIENQKYTTEQLDQMIEQMHPLMEQILRGENMSLEHVTEPLNMCATLDGYPFQISWESNNYDYINLNGTIENEELKEDVVLELTAKLVYENAIYYMTFPVVIAPREYTKEEALTRKINDLLNEYNLNTRTNTMYELPDNVDGTTIVWSEKKNDQTLYLLLLIFIACVLCVIGKDRDLKRQVEKRNKELQMDYSQLVSKITLYLGAGMTLRNVFMRLGAEYKQRNTKKKYVYEELLLTCHELSVGISEVEAYEHFGKRCKVRQYIRLGALLTQNIKKGSNNLIEMLRSESRDAFEERKNIARKYGEEAGTKLLGPMIMMLCVVMIIIMVPAYFSFSM